jgi:hypothetical protein
MAKVVRKLSYKEFVESLPGFSTNSRATMTRCLSRKMAARFALGWRSRRWIHACRLSRR